MEKRVKFYVKQKSIPMEIYKVAKEVFSELGIKEVEKDYDIAIAIGGDGTFLKAIRMNNFNTDILYTGISAGTLGFLQEVKKEEIRALGEAILNDNFSTKERIIEEINVDGNNYYALNEVAIRNRDLSVIGIKVDVDNEMLENLEGDGIIVSTPTGSSAYNLSLGGAIIYEGLECLQITPIAPLNTKAYRAIRNGVVIPKDITIDMLIHDVKNELLLSFDGYNEVIKNVKNISIKVSDKKVKCIFLNQTNYTSKINDKLLD